MNEGVLRYNHSRYLAGALTDHVHLGSACELLSLLWLNRTPLRGLAARDTHLTGSHAHITQSQTPSDKHRECLQTWSTRNNTQYSGIHGRYSNAGLYAERTVPWCMFMVHTDNSSWTASGLYTSRETKESGVLTLVHATHR